MKLSSGGTYVKETIQTLEKTIQLDLATDEDIAQLEPCLQELEELNAKYLEYEKEMSQLYMHKPDAAVVRAYEANQQHELRYQATNLQIICAARGGCCASERRCKWCMKPRNTHRESMRFGHCTVECGCCLRYRGFKQQERGVVNGYPYYINLEKRGYKTNVAFHGYVYGLRRDALETVPEAIFKFMYC